MRQNKINTIILSDSEINHIIYTVKKNEVIIEDCSKFFINIFDKTSINNALKEISQKVKNYKLTKLNIINDNVLKYQFIIEQNEVANLKLEVLNRFRTTFDISLNEYYIDFETYNFKEKIIVFIAGVNKIFLDSILRNFKSLKYKLLFLEVDIIALKRLVNSKFKDQIVMNIHLRDDKTIFIVMYNELLFTFRELNFGFKNILNFLYEKSKIDESKILENLNFENFPLTEALDKFTIELQRTIDFYNAQFRNKPISKIIITGKFLNIKGIENYLSQLFMIDSETFNGLKQFVLNTDVEKVEQLTYLQEILGTSLREV